MEMYFLKSAACLAILLLFYKLLLEEENMHRFKRFYLLASVVISIVIPFITFTTYIEAPSGTANVIYKTFSVSAIQNAENSVNFLPLILWGVYGLGVLFFSFVFLKNLKELLLKINRNPKLKKDHVTNVLLREEVTPHTFWNYIFLNKAKFETNSIPQEVFQHEEAHAHQKHSFDILFMELLQIVFWFNPLFYLAKNAIKLNHEFLADEAVLKKGANTGIYQETLLSFSSNQLNSSLSNSINYSSIKKRFMVMKTKTSKTAIWTRTLLLLPLLAVLLYSCSTKEVVEKEKLNEEMTLPNGNTILIVEDINLDILKNGNILLNNSPVSLEDLPRRLKKLKNHLSFETRKEMLTVSISAEPEAPMGVITDVKNVLRNYGVAEIKISQKKAESLSEISTEIVEEKPTQEKATPEMVAEYNKLAEYYNTHGVTKEIIDQKGLEQIEKEFSRILYIYKLMTPQQRRSAEKLPPPPPPAPLAPPEPIEEVMGYASPQSPAAKDARNKNLPPPPPPVEVMGYPAPPPPPPPSPEEAVQKWIEEGAVFYYNGKGISGKAALEIVQENGGKNLNVTVEDINSGKIVRLSDSDKANKENKSNKS